jgi:hypothetical protein
MDTVKITVRKDKETGRPIIFFVNTNPRGYWLECYDRIGQHSQCSREYMLRECAYMSRLTLDALDLIREWSQMGDPVNAYPCARLTYPKLPYIGS